MCCVLGERDLTWLCLSSPRDKNEFWYTASQRNWTKFLGGRGGGLANLWWLAFHPYMVAKLLATLYHRNWEKLSGLMRQLTGEQTFPLNLFSWIVKFNFYDKTFVISRVLYKYCVNVVHLYSQVEMMTFSAQSSVNWLWICWQNKRYLIFYPKCNSPKRVILIC